MKEQLAEEDENQQEGTKEAATQGVRLARASRETPASRGLFFPLIAP